LKIFFHAHGIAIHCKAKDILTLFADYPPDISLQEFIKQHLN